MPAQHHPAATQLAVDLGLIRPGTLEFVPLDEGKNYTLSEEVNVCLKQGHVQAGTGQ